MSFGDVENWGFWSCSGDELGGEKRKRNKREKREFICSRIMPRLMIWQRRNKVHV